MPDLLGSIVTVALTAAADQLGHECVRQHANDLVRIEQEAWQRDFEAGGISSWSRNNEQIEPTAS